MNRSLLLLGIVLLLLQASHGDQSTLQQSEWVKASDSVCLWPPNGKFFTFTHFLQQGKFFNATHPECPILSSSFSNCSFVELSTASSGATVATAELSACFYDAATDNLCVGSRRSGQAKGGRVYSAWVHFTVSCTNETQYVPYLVTVPHNPSGRPSCYSPVRFEFCSNYSIPPSPDPPNREVTVQELSALFQQKKQTLVEFTADQLLIDNVMDIDLVAIGQPTEKGLEFHYPIIFSGLLNEETYPSIIYSQAQGLYLSSSRFSLTYNNTSPIEKRQTQFVYTVTIKGDEPPTPSSLSTGAIVGIVIGSLVGVVAIGFLVFVFCKRKPYSSL